MKRILLAIILLISIISPQLIFSQSVESKSATRIEKDHSHVPQLELHDDDHEEHNDLLDHFEVDEMSPLMEWVTSISTEIIARITRTKRAFVAFLVKVKNYVVK